MADDRDLRESSPRKLAFKLAMLAVFSAGSLLGMGTLGLPFIAAFTGLAFAVEFRELLLWLLHRLPRAYLRNVGEHRLYSYCGSDIRVLGTAPQDAWFCEGDVLAALLLEPPPGLRRFSARERARQGGNGWYLSPPGVERLLRYHVNAEEASRFRGWLQREVFREKVAR